MSDRHVIIRGLVYPFEDKAPFVQSGRSVLGALEYDKSRDLVRCHECGGWFRNTGAHSAQAHGITAREYKEKHGLRSVSSLSVPSLVKARSDVSLRLNSAKFVKNFSIEKQKKVYRFRPRHCELINERGRCEAQLLKKVADLTADLKRAPRMDEVPDFHAVAKTFGSTSSALESLGMGRLPQARRYTRALIVELVRDFYVLNGRVPTTRDFTRCAQLPGKSTVLKIFGTAESLYAECGLIEQYRSRLRPTELLFINREQVKRTEEVNA